MVHKNYILLLMGDNTWLMVVLLTCHILTLCTFVMLDVVWRMTISSSISCEIVSLVGMVVFFNGFKMLKPDTHVFFYAMVY